MGKLFHFIDCILWVVFAITLEKIHVFFSIIGIVIATLFTAIKFYDYLKHRKK